MANNFRTHKADTNLPRPESVDVLHKTREHRGPGRGHDVDTPTGKSQLPEDGNIYRAKPLPPPEPKPFTPAASTLPSLPTQNSESATTYKFPAPMQSAPHGITNLHPAQEIAAQVSRDSSPPNVWNAVAKRKGIAHGPNLKPDNKRAPLTHNAPLLGRRRWGPH